MKVVESLRTTLIWALSATLLGIGLGVEEILSHGYLALGFERSAWLTFQDSVSFAFRTGLVAGLGWAVVVVVARWLAARTPRFEDPGSARPQAWRMAAGATVVLLVLGAWSVPRGGVDGSVVMTVAATTLAAAILFATRRGFELAVRLKTVLGAGAATVAFAAVMIPSTGLTSRFYFSTVEVVVRNMAVVASGALLFALTFAQLRRLAGAEPMRAPSWRSSMALAAGAIGLPAIVWLAATFGATPTVAVSNPRNIVLIGIDTLRADRTTLTRDEVEGRALTPNLRALASRGVVFDDAVSQSSWTMPSFASILTGRYPQEHGAMYLTGTLRESELTLPEILREAGYRTGAVVGHFYVDRRHGFSQGFDRFLEHYDALSHSLIGSREITDRALQFLGERGPEPFFLFAHYFDPHYEFMDQPEWSWADDYSGWLLEEERDIYNLRSKRHLLESSDVDYLRALYDEEIAYTDAQIGRLLSYLDSEGLTDDTAIIVVADHGEEFLERGWLGHTISLHEEIVRVPMLAVLPGVDVSHGVISGPVETRSLFGTVLDYLDIELPDPPPVSLLSRVHAHSDSGSADAYSSVWLPPGRADVGKSVLLSSLRSGDWKLIVDHLREKEFLYDLAEDPEERVNLATANPEKLAEMLVVLEAWVTEMQAAGGSIPHLEPNEELRDELRALGYL